MRTLASLALGAGLLAVSAIGMAEPASARGSFGVYIGGPGYGPGPGYYGGPGYAYPYRDYCRYWRYRRTHPYECDRYYDDPYYDAYYGDPYYRGYYPGGVFFGFNTGNRHRGHYGRNWGGRWGGHGGHHGGHGHH